MMSLSMSILVVVLIGTILCAAWTLLVILIGFRLGRMTTDKPMAPIVAAKPGKVGIEDDPYHEPMYGVSRNKSTMEEK